MTWLVLTTTPLGPGDAKENVLGERFSSGNHSRCPAAKAMEHWSFTAARLFTYEDTQGQKVTGGTQAQSLQSQKTINTPTVRALKEAQLGQTNSLFWLQLCYILSQMEKGIG